jgi:hypothetical protein
MLDEQLKPTKKERKYIVCLLLAPFMIAVVPIASDC